VNGDGAEDAGEAGLNGVTVELYDVPHGLVIDSKVTSGDGDYTFDSMLGGLYEVRVDGNAVNPLAYILDSTRG